MTALKTFVIYFATYLTVMWEKRTLKIVLNISFFFVLNISMCHCFVKNCRAGV